MRSAIVVSFAYALLTLVHCHPVKFSLNLKIDNDDRQDRYALSEVQHELREASRHTGNSTDDEAFDVSTLIEKANENLAQDPDGPLVLFGDIAMDLGFGNADPCTSRNCKWKKGSDGRVHVPYVISSAYSAREHSIIESALQSFFYSTCIQFERRNQHEDYLSIESRSGCYSFVGRRGGRQVVSLQRGGCVFHHVVQHEVIHALGFNHEQTRSDRDQHVRILYENIIRGQEHNFNKINTNNLGTPYDYGSVMHYSRFAFSGNGRPTIEPIPDPNVSIGRAREMSPIDIARINRLYECS